MKKNISIFSTTRADYSLLRNLVLKLQKLKRFDTNLVVSGTHFSKNFGSTFNEIKKDKIKKIKKIKIKKIEKYRNIQLIFYDIFKKVDSFTSSKKIDLAILLGDRFELLAISIVCFLKKIPICHLHGGEQTLGAIDNSIRNAITSLSQYHFTSNEGFKKKVQKIIGNSSYVKSVGALFLDNLKHWKKFTKKNIEKKFKFKFMKKNMLVTIHPETLSLISPLQQIKSVLSAVGRFDDILFIFTAPNIDTGSKIFFNEIKKFQQNNKNIIFIKSLGPNYYHSIIEITDGVMGNSSSGIIEVPYLKKGTVNIGNRQKGRPQESSVINCSFNKSEIVKSIRKLYSKKFQNSLKSFKATKYGIPGASKKIIKSIETII